MGLSEKLSIAKCRHRGVLANNRPVSTSSALAKQMEKVDDRCMATNNNAATTTYTKLNTGAWGVRTTDRVDVGQVVTVSKRGGTTKTEMIDKVLWTGKDRYTGKRTSLCAIVPTPREAMTTYSRPSNRMGSGHGTAAPVRGYAGYCTDNDSCRCYDCAS